MPTTLYSLDSRLFVCDGNIESVLVFDGPSQKRPSCLSSSIIYVSITTKKARKKRGGGGIIRQRADKFSSFYSVVSSMYSYPLLYSVQEQILDKLPVKILYRLGI